MTGARKTAHHELVRYTECSREPNPPRVCLTCPPVPLRDVPWEPLRVLLRRKLDYETTGRGRLPTQKLIDTVSDIVATQHGQPGTGFP